MTTLSPAEVAYQSARLGDDKRAGIAVSNGVCFGLAFIAVMLRICSRYLAHANYKADDWWIWGGLVSPILCSQSLHEELNRSNGLVHFHPIHNFVSTPGPLRNGKTFSTSHEY